MNITIEAIENRIKSLKDAVEKSIASHHALVGRLQESQELLEFMKTEEEKVTEVEIIEE